MLKQIAFTTSLLIMSLGVASAQLVKVAYTMNFHLNQATAAHFVDFASIKPDTNPAYRHMTTVIKYAQPQDGYDGTGKQHIAAKITHKYDCKYGAGSLVEHVEKYNDYDMNPGSLVSKTPKPSKNTITMYAQWSQEDGMNPVMIGHNRATFQDIACGRLKRSDFE